MEVRADVLLSELEVLREIKRLYSTELRLGDTLKIRLQAMAEDRRARESAIALPVAAPQEIQNELAAAGFKRRLKDFQLNNLCRISTLPHGADFSVPGAGKTTVGLANFALQRARGRIQRMLVVAPLAAFAAWKEDAIECFAPPPKVAVHLGNPTPLPATATILLTNYHRLSSDYDRVRAWVSRAPTQVILDEAHRVKRGRAGVHGRAALDLAFAAARRDVLTGTPAPQGAHDLVAMVRFLYPGQSRQIFPQDAFVERLGRDPSVLEQTHQAVRRYFVRTRKSDLGLPPTTMQILSKPMGPVQQAIYQALIGRYRGTFELADSSRHHLRRLGRIVMYLLEAATNPLLLTAGSDANDLPIFEHEPLALMGTERLTELLGRYAVYETPWKYTEAHRIVSEANSNSEKVLIWTNFVRNIRHLNRMLAPWNPAVVHGGIPPKDSASGNSYTTREDELDRFRFDANCSVLLANPAACGEGVSLHHWCHHAVYLDRTFNAGHFLQSQDRIHRLGLSDEISTRFTIFVSEASIDESVDQRLRDKVSALARLMDDPGLVQVALPINEMTDDSTDDDERLDNIDRPDIDAVIQHIDGYEL
jgi:SNF2 family DNA or RNA helicase